MHAEARTYPGLDGKVARDKITGKEVRYPVNLTSREKDMARRICVEFKQDAIPTTARAITTVMNVNLMVFSVYRFF